MVAKSLDFLLNQIRNAVGTLGGGTVTFYAAGTTTPLDIYLDRDMQSAAANPYTLTSDGTAELYGRGLYRVIFKDSIGVTAYDFDYISVYPDITETVADAEDVLASISGDYAPLVTVETIADLRGITGTSGQTIQVLGYYAAGDGGGGPVRYWDGASSDADNGGSIIKPAAVSGAGRWLIGECDTLDLRWFGVKDDGTTGDSSKVSACIAAHRAGSQGVLVSTDQCYLDASVAGIYGSFLTGSGRFLVTWDSGASDQYVSPADGFTVFVATTGSDSDDGLTPERPMKTVTNAVNKIKMFGSSAPFIISAADGTYAGEYFDVTGLNVSIVGDAAVIISSPAAGESSVVRGVGANLHLENVKIEDFVQCAINLSRNSTLTTTNVDLETATATAVGVQLYLDSAYDTTGITYTGSYTHESRYDVQQGVAPTATGLNLGFPIEWDNVYARTINLGVIGSMGLLTISYGTGSPESNVSARIGSIYLRVDGGAGTTLYVKESGAGTNTGWIAK